MAYGADEVDVVFRYRAFMAGNVSRLTSGPKSMC